MCVRVYSCVCGEGGGGISTVSGEVWWVSCAGLYPSLLCAPQELSHSLWEHSKKGAKLSPSVSMLTVWPVGVVLTGHPGSGNPGNSGSGSCCCWLRSLARSCSRDRSSAILQTVCHLSVPNAKAEEN